MQRAKVVPGSGWTGCSGVCGGDGRGSEGRGGAAGGGGGAMQGARRSESESESVWSRRASDVRSAVDAVDTGLQRTGGWGGQRGRLKTVGPRTGLSDTRLQHHASGELESGTNWTVDLACPTPGRYF